MKSVQQENKTLFSITEEEVQEEAMRHSGRHLTDEEAHIVGKCVGCGFSTEFLIILRAAINEAVNKDTKKTV